MDDSDWEIDNQDYQEDAASKEEMELDNTTDCNQNISHDTSATLVSSDNAGDEEEENVNLVAGGVTLENSPKLESGKYQEEEEKEEEGQSENDGQELTSSSSSSSLSEGSSPRRRVRPILSAEVEVVKYIKTRVVPYKPSCKPNPNISLERRVMRAAKPYRPRVDSQSSGQLSEASSCTGSSQSSSQTLRISGRFERPRDTEDEAEVKSQEELKEDPCRFHDQKKREILMHIYGRLIKLRNKKESKMSTNSEDSDVGRSETPCACPPGEAKDSGECCGSRREEESCGATGYGHDAQEGAKGSGSRRKKCKSDYDDEQEVQEEEQEQQKEEEEEEVEEEFEYVETESEDGVDYDKKNDYNDYAYNLSCLEDSDD